MSRDVRYDVGERCVMDIYVPANAQDASAPVALFIHGGVWAAGEKWQFSPLGENLAREGVVTCVATYSLYPTADAVQMWDEVSRAISFVMDNIGDYGGDARKISLVGHSAGAQLCARALLQRSGVKNVQSRTNMRDWHADVRMPNKFIGLAGVYDVGYHYTYEDSRGVAIVSTMGRAMNGPENFDVCSPARLLPKRVSSVASKSSLPPGPVDLEGDKIANMAGFSRGVNGTAAATSTEEFHFPPTILMAGCADVTVPWYESADFHWKLQDAAVPSRLLLYLREGHTEFVLDWDEKRPRDSLPAYSRDFLRILKH
jgi:acetyl esterase/lipase